MKPLISVIVPIYKSKIPTICVDSLPVRVMEIWKLFWQMTGPWMSVRQSVTNIRTKTIESK